MRTTGGLQVRGRAHACVACGRRLSGEQAVLFEAMHRLLLSNSSHAECECMRYGILRSWHCAVVVSSSARVLAGPRQRPSVLEGNAAIQLVVEMETDARRL